MNWLLLRGLAREQRHWGAFVPALREHGAVYCLDLPGAGTERERTSPATVKAIAGDVRARWQRLGASGPWGLFAVSLGGMVAMEWCAAHPDDFSALVLANTSAGDLTPPWRRMNLRVVPQVLLSLLSRDPVERERRILRITTRLCADAALPAVWASYPPISRANVLRQLRAASRFRAPAALGPRTLVISSAQDAFTHPDCPRALARHLNAPLLVHPKAGHDIATDDPAWLAGEVGRFATSPMPAEAKIG